MLRELPQGVQHRGLGVDGVDPTPLCTSTWRTVIAPPFPFGGQYTTPGLAGGEDGALGVADHPLGGAAEDEPPHRRPQGQEVPGALEAEKVIGRVPPRTRALASTPWSRR